MERAQAGDHGAFRQLFELYAPQMHRIVFRMLGEPEDAADLTQDIFVRAYQRLGTVKYGQAFHAWLTRLAVNMAHDRLRKHRPKLLSLDAPVGSEEDGPALQIPDSSAGSEELLLKHELSGQVRQALQTLSNKHRDVLILHHLEGLAVEEIAAILAVPTGTVKSRLARARAELKRKLSGYVEE